MVQMTDGDMLHYLLPWYVNGTLSSGERAGFEAHLGGCAACQRARQTLLVLRSEIEQQGESLFEDHPSSLDLVAFARNELPEEESGRVQRHLVLCGPCALEKRWVLGDAAGQQVARTSPQRTSLRRYFMPLAAAAGLILAVTLWPLLQQQDGGTAGTRLVDVYFLDSTVRAAEPQILQVPADVASFTLFLQVDALPEELPLEVEVLDAAGNSIYQGVQDDSLVRDTFLVLNCGRSDFPDGDYVARVRSKATADAVWTEYPFQVRS